MINPGSTEQQSFCRFLAQGLVYNNQSTAFSASPCCYYSEADLIDLKSDVSAQLISFREKWKTNDIHKTCKICIDAENAGLHSYRESSFDLCSGQSDQIEMLTVAVNKMCNLACPICDANHSSYWHRENMRNGVEQSQKVIELHREDKSGYTTKKFIGALTPESLAHVSYIKFGGGEPLMTDTHLEILNNIPNPNNVVLQYTSNFSIMPTEKVLTMWQKFKLVKWCASIDGIEQRFSYLRWPHTWEKLTSLVAAAKDIVPHNVMFGVEHTLNPLNVWYYAEFEQWFNCALGTNNSGDTSDLTLHPCHGPMALDQTHPDLRAALSDKYGKDHNIVQLLQYYPYRGHENLVMHLNQIDGFRNLNWRETFSEIAAYYD